MFGQDNVVSCRAVLPSSEVREFRGANLDLIRYAEGTSGIITEVTVRLSL